MNVLHKQNEAKLHILQSLARSQRALARMIEAMADAQTENLRSRTGSFSPEEASGPPAAGGVSRREGDGHGQHPLADNMRAIASFQRALAAKIAGIRIGRIRAGQPGKAWLNRTVSGLYDSEQIT